MVPMPRLRRELWDEGVGRCKAFPPPLLACMRKSPSDHWRLSSEFEPDSGC